MSDLASYCLLSEHIIEILISIFTCLRSRLGRSTFEGCLVILIALVLVLTPDLLRWVLQPRFTVLLVLGWKALYDLLKLNWLCVYEIISLLNCFNLVSCALLFYANWYVCLCLMLENNRESPLSHYYLLTHLWAMNIYG